jgi:hypothetical protein
MGIPIGYIDIDRPRTIKYSYTSMLMAQELTGKTALQIVTASSMFDLDVIAKLLCVGSMHEDKDMTVKKAIAIIEEKMESDLGIIVKIAKVVTDIFTETTGAFLKSEEVTDPNAKTAANNGT